MFTNWKYKAFIHVWWEMVQKYSVKLSTYMHIKQKFGPESCFHLTKTGNILINN